MILLYLYFKTFVLACQVTFYILFNLLSIIFSITSWNVGPSSLKVRITLYSFFSFLLYFEVITALVFVIFTKFIKKFTFYIFPFLTGSKHISSCYFLTPNDKSATYGLSLPSKHVAWEVSTKDWNIDLIKRVSYKIGTLFTLIPIS